jgi:transposase
VDTGVSKTENRPVRKKRYSAEFKREAARLMIMDGENPREVAERLGVNISLLYRWKQEQLEEQDAAKGGKPGVGAVEMAAEIEELRTRLAKAERINQILKKTVSYFAREE